MFGKDPSSHRSKVRQISTIPENLTFSWKKVVQDDSIACRLYELPKNLYKKFRYKHHSSLGCSASGKVPWVDVKGDTLYVVKQGEVVCNFEGPMITLLYYWEFSRSKSYNLCVLYDRTLQLCHIPAESTSNEQHILSTDYFKYSKS